MVTSWPKRGLAVSYQRKKMVHAMDSPCCSRLYPFDNRGNPQSRKGHVTLSLLKRSNHATRSFYEAERSLLKYPASQTTATALSAGGVLVEISGGLPYGKLYFWPELAGPGP